MKTKIAYGYFIVAVLLYSLLYIPVEEIDLFGSTIEYSYIDIYEVCQSPLGMLGGTKCSSIEMFVMIITLASLIVLGIGIYKTYKRYK